MRRDEEGTRKLGGLRRGEDGFWAWPRYSLRDVEVGAKEDAGTVPRGTLHGDTLPGPCWTLGPEQLLALAGA